MIAYFLLGICLLVGVVLIARWFATTEPRRVVLLLRWVVAILGLIVGAALLWGGRDVWAMVAIPMLIPLAMRWRALWNRMKAAQGPIPGQTSQVETRFLRMSLDHDSGTMDGMVVAGSFQGRRLGTLSLEDLVALWRECRGADTQSAAVLEAYLDRAHGQDWREAADAGTEGGREAPRGAAGGPMSREEALEILGLDADPSREAILSAHRRLMQKVHPDHGGSNYLAAKINEAKDLLLRG